MWLSKVVWLFLFLLGNPTGRGGEEGFQEELGLRLRLNVEFMGSGEVQGRPHSSQRRNPEMARHTVGFVLFGGWGTILFWPLGDTGTHH